MQRKSHPRKNARLTELPATAICGNDITSSVLYVSALSIIAGGKWAWVSLSIVAIVLFLFRSIYAEVVGALPLNGGAYNALLNTTSKRWASIAACLTILSYMATAVISAGEAMHYAHFLWSGLPVYAATIFLLAIFMVLSIIGIQESSRVAVAIFIFHLTSLTVLVVAVSWFLFNNGLDTFFLNWNAPSNVSVPKALFFGFAAAMLGISGFESSSNFVEEQAKGVFEKTLRNMWVTVSIFNPTIAFLAITVIPITEVGGHRENLLSHMGFLTGGSWLAYLISIDAVFVLSGAVLTSFIGVNGLIKRITLDRVLPQFFLKTNHRGTTHRIVIVFFILTVSVHIITEGDLAKLAGVYTISFLSVMALFGIGNVLLKVKRSRLPRPLHASWPTVLIGISAVLAGILGHYLMNPDYFRVFLTYFIPTLFITIIMLGRIWIIKVCIYFIRRITQHISGLSSRLAKYLYERMDEINSQQFVFFTRGDSVGNLNEAMLYVRKNEHTNRIKIVTVVKNQKEVPKRLEKDLAFLDEAYPEIDIEFVIQEGEFGPKIVKQLSKEWKIPTNFMFIASPGDQFLFSLEELGGVRLII